MNPQASTGGRRSRLADIEQFEERTRQLKDYEMYSKLYYDEKISPIVKEVENELGSMELLKGKKLNLRKRIARDLYDGEDDVVKELVIAKLKERAKHQQNPRHLKSPCESLMYLETVSSNNSRTKKLSLIFTCIKELILVQAHSLTYSYLMSLFLT